MLARHGAIVVVNDLGVSLAGESEGGPSPADAVVAEIEAAGGHAMSDGTSVTNWNGVEACVQSEVLLLTKTRGSVNPRAANRRDSSRKCSR